MKSSSDFEKVSKKIIKKAQKGDHEALEIIIEAYSSFVYFLVSKRIKDISEAENCTQETLGRIVSKIKLYEIDKVKFNTWIYNLTMNCTKNYIRDYKISNDTIEINSEEVYNYGVVENYCSDKLSDLEKSIGTEYYEILLLRHGYNYKFHEIAAIKNLNISKVKRLFYEAEQKVEKYKEQLDEKRY